MFVASEAANRDPEVRRTPIRTVGRVPNLMLIHVATGASMLVKPTAKLPRESECKKLKLTEFNF